MGCASGSALICRIRKLLDREWDVRISHIFGEANASAELLANLGCNRDQNWRIFYCPPAVLEPHV